MFAFPTALPTMPTTPGQPGAAAAPGQAADVFEQLLAGFAGAAAPTPETAAPASLGQGAPPNPAVEKPAASAEGEAPEAEVLPEIPAELAMAQPWPPVATPPLPPAATEAQAAAAVAAAAPATGAAQGQAAAAQRIAAQIPEAPPIAPDLDPAGAETAEVASPPLPHLPKASGDTPAGAAALAAARASKPEAAIPSTSADTAAPAASAPGRAAEQPAAPAQPRIAEAASRPPVDAPAAPPSQETAPAPTDPQALAKAHSVSAPQQPLLQAAVVQARSVPAASSPPPPVEEPTAPADEAAPAVEVASGETPAAPSNVPEGRRREPAARESGQKIEANVAGAAPAALDEAAPPPAIRPAPVTAPETPKPQLQAAAAAPETPVAVERPETPRNADAAAASIAGPAVAEAAAARDPAAGVRGAPDTVAALAADIARKLEGRSTRFQVELQPAGLGRVEVQIEIGAAGKLTAAFAVDSPQAAAELRSRAPELQRALEQAGFDLSGGLSFDLADNSRFGRDPEARQDGGAFRGRAFAQALATGEAADQAALPPKLSSRPSAALDIRI